jgi:hypothetical protein
MGDPSELRRKIYGQENDISRAEMTIMRSRVIGRVIGFMVGA